MNICEATKKALEENKCIREKPYKVKVKPIKGDVGTIMGLDGSHPVKGWQPTARELISESWYTNNTSVTEDKFGNKSFGKIEPKLRKNDGFMAFDVAMFCKDELEVQIIYV